jgi:hypothetical protein
MRSLDALQETLKPDAVTAETARFDGVVGGRLSRAAELEPAKTARHVRNAHVQAATRPPRVV